MRTILIQPADLPSYGGSLEDVFILKYCNVMVISYEVPATDWKKRILGFSILGVYLGRKILPFCGIQNRADRIFLSSFYRTRIENNLCKLSQFCRKSHNQDDIYALLRVPVSKFSRYA